VLIEAHLPFFKGFIHRKDAEYAEELFFHLPLRGRQMKIRNRFVV
jgi:hypothetical protein